MIDIFSSFLIVCVGWYVQQPITTLHMRDTTLFNALINTTTTFQASPSWLPIACVVRLVWPISLVVIWIRLRGRSVILLILKKVIVFAHLERCWLNLLFFLGQIVHYAAQSIRSPVNLFLLLPGHELFWSLWKGCGLMKHEGMSSWCLLMTLVERSLLLLMLLVSVLMILLLDMINGCSCLMVMCWSLLLRLLLILLLWRKWWVHQVLLLGVLLLILLLL